MITKRIFHTYKEDFPLLRIQGNCVEFPHSFNLNELFRNLILELSELSRIPEYCYITRHTDDVPGEKILKPFKDKFRNIVNKNPNSKFGVPTVWFVAYSDNLDSIISIKRNLADKRIEFWEENVGEYESLDSIPPDGSYTSTKDEAILFPKFLHQTTQIGIDLLKNNSTDKLKELKELEWMSGNELDSKIEELKIHLIKNSKYYLEKINVDNIEESKFWANFRIVHGGYSWPHFLFNICGV